MLSTDNSGINYIHMHYEIWILERGGMNTCSTRYEYLHDGQPESMSSWISFERENYVEDVHGFRFANFLTDRQKYWQDWSEKKKTTSKNV